MINNKFLQHSAIDIEYQINQMTKDSLPLTFEPLSPANWNQFEKLFGERGACGGCWCMSFRLKRADFEEGKGQGNKDAMKKLVFENRTTGLLGFYEGEAIAWLSMSPR